MYMMQNVINSVKRLGNERKLNILTGCQGNEKYISLLCNTGHNFYVWKDMSDSKWKDSTEKAPSNLTVISPASQIITSFDAIMCHERTTQYDEVLKISTQLCLPMIMVDHCSRDLIRPHNALESVNGNVEVLMNRRADVVVASNDICTDWETSDSLNMTIPTSVDLNKFKKDDNRRNGNTFFESSLTPMRIAFDNDIPRPMGEVLFRPIGQSYSILPTDCDIANKEIIYQTANYFMHPYKNITVKLLEAMASENVVICFDTLETRRFFKDGVDAVFISSPQELKDCLLALDSDESRRKGIGAAARQKVKSICEENNFIKKWDFVFDCIRSHFYQRLG